jgi:choline dehydrogenase-like flavoprotein
MFVSIDQLDAEGPIEADVCIIGGGAAGITIARELDGTSISVALFESGNLEFDPETQDLYAGEIIGAPFAPLDVTRLRYFGGSTNHWNGFCRPLDPVDFEVRNWMDKSGWPIGYDEMIPFYRRAQEHCQLGPLAYSAADWNRTGIPAPEMEEGRVVLQIAQYCPPTRFGSAYREELKESSNVTVYVQSNVVEIDTDGPDGPVRLLRLASLARKRFTAQGKIYILACGGIENARILLQSDRHKAVGLGNEHDLVGRYFADHPLIRDTGILYFPGPGQGHRALLRQPVTFRDGAADAKLIFALSQEVIRKERLLNCGFTAVLADSGTTSGTRSFYSLARSLKGGEFDNFLFHAGRVMADLEGVYGEIERRIIHPRSTYYYLSTWYELPPIHESRITLSSDRDALDQRRVALDWRLPDDFLEQIHKSHRILGEELGRSQLARIQLDLPANSESLNERIENSHHHMGATRMSDDPRTGVVDRNCQVHGTENLMIAGSSVFPTFGHANPTLTIVALAIRLADHVKQRML